MCYYSQNDRVCISKQSVMEEPEERPESPYEKRKMTKSWQNLRAQSKFLWEEIPRKKPLEVPAMNKTTSPEVPQQFNLRLMRSKCGTFRRVSTSKMRPRTGIKAPPFYAPFRGEVPGGGTRGQAMEFSPGAKGKKMYWKALKELGDTSPTHDSKILILHPMTHRH